ncbi:LOW QUALITY PROTEIN: two-component response regulator [Geomicrobium sp. JCM 19038]|nr:LOW QUALITY PROTEIN: two-component response regulator [Geomicrobium sp. JCM 19038]
MSYTVFLVEDEQNLSEALKAYMEREGWTVQLFHDGDKANEAVEETPHLWYLILCYQVQTVIKSRTFVEKQGDIPVIFISARDQDLDRVLGLEMGSDDYISKPFLPQELIIRAKKLLTRTYGQESEESKKIELNDYTIDAEARTVTDNHQPEQPVDLTTKEMDLILLLTEQVGKALSREDIIEEVWGENYFGSERAVDDVVRRVRKKMPRIHLETLYGFGYRILSS